LAPLILSLKSALATIAGDVAEASNSIEKVFEVSISNIQRSPCSSARAIRRRHSSKALSSLS
jgi:hypothetical protein